MKVSELKKVLEHSRLSRNPDREDYDEEVVVVLKEPSIGWRATTKVTSAYYGFDWDKGKLLLVTEDPLVVLKEKEALWQMAQDFIYQLSEEKTYKGNPTTLATRAKQILARAKEKVNVPV
jgi:hypothetical protein